MTEDKKKILERASEKFLSLDEESKNFIAGYMTGIQEERAKWEQKPKIA